ncbi:MAG: hypothetical protein WC663_01285 [Patescibacteria group bacterium]|jgi:hypothetical protein
MKRITAFLVIVGLFFSISNCFATKINYQDSGLGISILLPSTWTLTSSKGSRFFYGKNIILFSIQKAGVSTSEINSWKKNHLGLANSFAIEYAKGFSQGVTSIHPTRVKNYTKLPYKAAKVIYKGHSGNTKIKTAQIIIIKNKKLYLLTGFAKLKKFDESNTKYFAPVFQSFRLL